MKPDSLHSRDRLVAESLSQAFGEDQSLPRSMARKIRRRRRAKTFGGVGVVAAIVAVVIGFAEVRRNDFSKRLVKSADSIQSAARVVASPNPGYEIATDEEVRHFLRDRSFLILSQPGNAQAKRVVWLETKKPSGLPR